MHTHIFKKENHTCRVIKKKKKLLYVDFSLNVSTECFQIELMYNLQIRYDYILLLLIPTKQNKIINLRGLQFRININFLMTQSISNFYLEELFYLSVDSQSN